MTTTPFQAGLGEADDLMSRRTIPFDYAFRYDLVGEPGNTLNKTVTVSIEAAFVAVSIGYGVVPKVTPITFGPKLPFTPPTPLPGRPSPVMLSAWASFATGLPPQLPTLRDIPLGVLLDSLDPKLPETSRLLKRETGPEAVFMNGIKLNPEFAERALAEAGNVPLDVGELENLFQVVGAPPEQIQFMYAIFDEGSGREFQSEPILNIAGLGISNGDRPFRYFAQPITFAPQTTIRMQVTEVSDFEGELHVALHGYKALGGAGTPTGRVRQGMRRIRGR